MVQCTRTHPVGQRLSPSQPVQPASQPVSAPSLSSHADPTRIYWCLRPQYYTYCRSNRRAEIQRQFRNPAEASCFISYQFFPPHNSIESTSLHLPGLLAWYKIPLFVTLLPWQLRGGRHLVLSHSTSTKALIFSQPYRSIETDTQLTNWISLSFVDLKLGQIHRTFLLLVQRVVTLKPRLMGILR